MTPREPPDRDVRAFDVTSHGPGDESKDIVVDLPTRWARHHDDARVQFRDTGEFGVHATLVGDDGTDVLRFPWYDHADRQLRDPDACEFPVTLDEDGTWEDVEQGWWATITDVSGTLYIAETDSDALLAAPMPAVDVSCDEPGHVRVSGVDIRWASVSRAAYDAAWREAVASVHGE